MAQLLTSSLQNLSSHVKLGNVFKAANRFMDSHEEDLKTNIDVVLKHFQCSNDLEKLIKIRLINRFKCHDEVLNLLKSEDLFNVSLALQCTWFFENSNFDPHLLVDCVLPLMSYTTRFKVLKRYSKSLKNPEIAVSFFNCLRQRYGLNTALLLLPVCNESFIEKILMTSSVSIHVSVLLSVYHTHPSIVINYLSHLLENASAKKRIYRIFRFSSYEKLFILIAKKEPQKFTMLMEKYHRLIPYMKLGKRSTKQFVKIAFDSIKNNVWIYKRILNWKFVVSCLNLDQISELQYNFLPKTVNDFFQNYSQYSDYVLVVSSLKESVKMEMFISNFQKAYNKPLTAYLNVISLDSVHLLPAEIKESWVETKLPTLDNPGDKARHIIHLPISKSLPLLMKMVELQTDVDTRIVILKCMFKTVIENNDQELIKKICLYALNRFRNDKYIIRESLISELQKFKGLLKLPEDCWEIIEEIININILENDRSKNINMVLVVDVLKARIHSRLLRNLPVDSYFEKLLILSSDYSTFELCKNTQYEKYCLKWFLDNLPEKKLDKTKKDLRMEKNYALLEAILKRLCQWNACHLNDRIDFPEWLNNWIDINFDIEDNEYHKQSILEEVKKDGRLKLDFYWKIFPNYINPQILIYNLYQDPERVSSNAGKIISKILNEEIKSYQPFFKQSRLYPALKLSDIISNHCINILTNKVEDNEDSRVDEKRKSIEILSVLTDTAKFVELIKEFYPISSVMDNYSDEGRELFQLQTEITTCLKYVSEPSEVLETLRKFAVGDYLKLVVGSLNSICLRTPENKILKLLKEWFDCPISLRKHLFRAYFRLAPVLNTMETIVGHFENEENMSLRVLLFNHAFRLFQKEPSSETFMVLKAVVGKLNSSDDSMITQLLATENVPDEYVSEYMELLWNVINHNIENEVLLKEYRSKVIALIEPNILQVLNEQFCDVLIKEVFLHKTLDIFVPEYLLNCKNSEQLNSRYEKVFCEIEILIMKWDEYDLKSDVVFKNRRVVSYFVDCLVRKSFSVNADPSIGSILLQKIKTSLINSLQEHNILEEILLIEISLFLLISQESDDSIHQFMKFIEGIVDKVVNSYGTALIDTVNSTLEKALSWKYSKNTDFSLDNYLLSFSETLFSSSSRYCFILGLKILPTVITSDINKYKNLVTTLFQVSDPEVRFYVNKFFRALVSRVIAE